jgi:capsular exopolysaccharide synthesis family protein
MTAQLTRIDTLPTHAPSALAQSYPVGPIVPPPVSHISWRRYGSALYRYKWLILAIVLFGVAIGVVVARRSVPEYEVHATVWLSAETPQGRTAGPIRPERLLNTSSWPDLLGSFAILDSVVRKTHLYVVPENNSSASILATFSTTDRYEPGNYELRVTPGTNRYELADENVTREKGAIGDSIGRSLGFRWAPDSSVLRKVSPVRFRLNSTREAAVELRSVLSVTLPRESSLLRLVLTGSDPKRTTETMDTLLAEFMATASRLKRRNLADFATTLDQQVTYSAGELRSAEAALETFRVKTITLPSEGGTIAAGLEMTRDPVLKHFFEQKLQLDSLRNDRESLQHVLNGLQNRQLESYALWSIPAVHGSPELSAALNELATKESALRSALQLYTDEHRSVIDLRERITTLRAQTIRQLASSLLDDVSRKEQELASRVDGSSRELQQIPRRTIEEMRLRRNVEVRQQLYTMLKSRYEEARLSEASALPDLSVLDYPAVPQTPTRNTATRTILLAITLSFTVAILLALLLDHLDGRFRHPEQATHELGLEIIGVVPTVGSSSSGKRHSEEAWQVTECFRTMRLALLHRQASDGPFARMLAISSPSSGEGKSLVAANLAVSLAKAGHRTLLVDGDVRRGCLHSTFALRARPGLTDYLAGNVGLPEILCEVDGGLTVIPSGSRNHRSPELLSSPAMRELLAQVREQYDSIIVDCAPLNAGVDAYAVGALTTNLILVLRAGVTDCRLAEAKLKLVDHLPINVLGAVLNAVQTTGEYRYYAYHYKQGPALSSGGRVRTLFVD